MVIRALRLLCAVAVVAALALTPAVQRTVFANRTLAIPNCTGTYSISAAPISVSGTAQLQENTSSGALTGSLNITSPIPSKGSVQGTVLANGSVSGSLTIVALGGTPIPFTGTVNADCSSATLTASVLGLTDTITLKRTSQPTATPTPTHLPATSTPTQHAATATPTHSAATSTPTHTGATATPTHTGATSTPTPRSATATPTRSGATATPTRTGATATPTSTPSSAPMITVSASQLTPLQSLTVTGAGFGATEKIKVFWGSIFSLPAATVNSDGSGSFSATFIVPPATYGAHRVIAVGQQSHRSARATVHIQPVTYLLHTSGTIFSFDVLWGFGFAAREKVTGVWQPGNRTLGHVTTNGSGSFGLFNGIRFFVPFRAPGQYEITATGQKSGQTSSNTFTLTTRTPPPTNTPTTVPGATNTPTSGGGGTPPNCTGNYTIGGTIPNLPPVQGTAVLQDNSGTISGSLNFTAPIPSPGSVNGTVAADGTVSASIVINALGSTPIHVTGSVNADCSSGTLTGTALGITATFTLTRASGGPTATPTITPVSGGGTPTPTPVSGGTGPNCTGNYSITGLIPGLPPVQGTAALQDTNGTISGSLNFTAPIPASGSVNGTVATDGTVNATISVAALGAPIPVSGSVNADCSSGSLTGTALGFTVTFTLTRTSGTPATPTNTPVSGGGGNPATPTNTPTSTATSVSGGGSNPTTPTNTPTRTAGPPTPSGVTPPPPATSAGCPPQGHDLATSAKVAQLKVLGGGMVTVGIHTAAGVEFQVALQISTKQTGYVGKGKQRHRVSRTVVLYNAENHGSTDSKGLANSRLHIAFNPPKDATALIVVLAHQGCSVGVGRAKVTILHKIPRFAIGTRVAAASSPAKAKGTNCTASVSLAVTVTFGPHKTWSKGAVLVYQPPKGVSVLNAGKGYHGKGAVRFAIPRPSNDQSTVVVKLSTHPGTVRIKTAHGWRLSFQVQIGGTLGVLSKQNNKLGQLTLNVGQPQLCTGAPPKKTTPGAKATPTARAGATATATSHSGNAPTPTTAAGTPPTATPVSGNAAPPTPTSPPAPTATTPPAPPTATTPAGPSAPNCTGHYTIVGSIPTTPHPSQVSGTVDFIDNNGIISGSVDITQGPAPSTGTVGGTVSPSGAVQGTISLLNGLSFTLAGQVNADCSSGTLSGTVIGVPATFTLTRTSP